MYTPSFRQGIWAIRTDKDGCMRRDGVGTTQCMLHCRRSADHHRSSVSHLSAKLKTVRSISSFRSGPCHRTAVSVVAASAASGVSKSEPSAARHVLGFVERQFLPLGLLTSLLIGYTCPGPGLQAARLELQRFATIGIFVIQGLNLRRGEAAKALTSWGATLYGIAAILLLTPLLAIPVQRLPLGRPELAFGLAVFCCMPTALSSGVTLTQAVGGNTALALLLVITTNLGGIFTMPFMLAALLRGSATGVALSPLPLLRALLQTILAPLLVGVSIRAFSPGAARLMDTNKRWVTLASGCLLILVPWMQVSRAASSNIAVAPSSIAWVVVAGAAIHLVFLAANMTAVRLLGIGGGRSATASGGSAAEAAVGVQRAVILVTSQKTLPVAVTVLGQLAAAGVAPGAAGLATVPAVIAHLVQIILDSVLASRWQSQDAAAAQKAAWS